MNEPRNNPTTKRPNFIPPSQISQEDRIMRLINHSHYGSFKNSEGLLPTLEEVKTRFNELYNNENNTVRRKVELKAWLQYCNSRAKNSHSAMRLETYTCMMRIIDLIDQVRYDVIDCSDIGTKDYVISKLKEEL